MAVNYLHVRSLKIDLVGTTGDLTRLRQPRPLLVNHLEGKNRRTAGRIGKVGLARERQHGIIVPVNAVVREVSCSLAARLRR